MRIFLPILIFMYTLVVGFRTDEGEPEGKRPASGFIDIAVESNVSIVNFTYALNDKVLSKGNETSPVDSNLEMARIIVPVKEFRCNNEVAFQDFLTLLKADDFPNLTITIPKSVLMQVHYGEPIIIHNVLINIAGVSKKYDIGCIVENNYSKDYVLIGSIKIKLTALNIEPPVKLFGLVKIKDEVIVKFGFSLNDNSLALNKN
jgi:hypothetical protein